MKRPRPTRTAVLAAIVAIATLMVAATARAHHGSGISYDLTKPWTTTATITDFKYINPHPLVLFDRTDEKGVVQHWHSEIITNPSRMIRAGWTKSVAEEAIKPGTVVTLTLATSKAGGFSALITKIVTAKGEEVITADRP
jgi:hypothetical protein